MPFQFTHPGKGATPRGTVAPRSRAGFNSRTLGRVRQDDQADKVLPLRFQFTHPGKGATSYRSTQIRLSMFQFTHPGKGATRRRGGGIQVQSCFNSRTLGRVRQKPPSQVKKRSSVSIHAPWEGCDVAAISASLRLPMFQFTHPGKGATILIANADLDRLVSIHAPWEGCDDS